MPKVAKNTSEYRIAEATARALNEWNTNYNTSYDFGTNFNSVNTPYKTLLIDNLFPKINETDLINVSLGNTFNLFAKEIDFIGQLSEEYVFKDSIPSNMNLNQPATLMLERKRPEIITKLYSPGTYKKQKFTLNDNDVRQNFMTLGDAVIWALGAYQKAISDINVQEEREIKAMLVDYSLNHVRDKITSITSREELFNEVFTKLQDLQTNSELYNESNKASGGEIGRYTTMSDIDDLFILTTTRNRTYFLNNNIARVFNSDGLDIQKRIIAFPEMGGNYKIIKDVTLTQKDVDYFKSFGDYQSKVGDIVQKDVVFTFDITQLESFQGAFIEITPNTDLFAVIFDKKALRYRRYTKNMLSDPFKNEEFRDTTYWLHYYSQHIISPFFNKSVIMGLPA